MVFYSILSFYSLMKELHIQLTKRGWSEQDIHAALQTLEQGNKKKSSFIRVLDTLVSWLFLIVAIIGSFIVSVILVPILVTMQGAALYFVLFVTGLFFGTLLWSILVHLKKLKYFIVPQVLIPVLALTNVYIITKFSNDLIELLNIPTLEHSPTLVSLVYVFAFFLPKLGEKVYSFPHQQPSCINSAKIL